MPTFSTSNAPPPLSEDVVLANQRIEEIKIRLSELDVLSIRALRTKGIGRGKPEDDTSLSALEDEAETLRAELVTLQTQWGTEHG